MSFGTILLNEYLPRFDLLTLMQILDTGKELVVPLCQVRTWKQNNFCKIRVIIRSFVIWIMEDLDPIFIFSNERILENSKFSQAKDKASFRQFLPQFFFILNK